MTCQLSEGEDTDKSSYEPLLSKLFIFGVEPAGWGGES